MEADGIIPDIIDDAPSAELTIVYPGNLKVEFGGKLTPKQVKDQPEVKWKADPGKYYLLGMVDPDAPSRDNPIHREFNHWLVGNIKGNNISTGDVIAGYRGSGPPKDTGLHRYIFLVFEQKEKLTFDEPRTPGFSTENRRKFSIRSFGKKYNLGKPVAGNYFKAEWEPFVDEVKNNPKQIMESDGIVPDIVDEAPTIKLTVIYQGNIELEVGGELTPTQVKDQPEVKWDADPNKYYLLAMVDPDAPSRANPIAREVLHWMVGNIKGNKLSTGEVVAGYVGAGAPKGTGLHRYIFLLFEQKEKLTLDETRIAASVKENRYNFSIRNFAKKHNLGNAIAGNYFNAQWDPYVEELRKKYA